MTLPLLYDRVIIGAGPAGLAAAISSTGTCLVLERNPSAGKKLLLSGSGQCNFTHDLSVEDFLARCGPFARFLKPSLYTFGPQSFIELLREYGCPSFIRDDGKVFPQSLQAADVRDALLSAAHAKGVKFAFGNLVSGVEANDGHWIITAEGGRYRSRKLVLAGGGASWPRTGSDGSCYTLARQLGHTIQEPRPALAALEVEGYAPFRDCAGIALPYARASFKGKHGKALARGSLLFTHTGLSGPLVLDNSHLLSAGDTVTLHLVDDADARILDLCGKHPTRLLPGALKALGIPEALLNAILSSSGVDCSHKCAELPRAERMKAARVLSAFPFTVRKLEDLTTAMLTAGGVPLSEVKAASMESRLRSGLYFAGELLDYNLPTGGFNIQAAFSTGWLAGRS